MRIFLLILLFFINLDSVSIAQSSAKTIRHGNKAYSNEQYENAEILYRKALEIDNLWEKQALFNMGNSLYRQQEYEESANLYFKLSINKSLSEFERAEVYHNLGNAYLMQNKYMESIEAYKQSLRLNPNSEDTRYNLCWAMKMIRNQEDIHNQGNDSDKQKNNKDKQDKQEQQYEKDLQVKRDKMDQEGQDLPQMSKKDIDRMLNAISNRDKQTLDEIRQKESIKINYKPERDW